MESVFETKEQYLEMRSNWKKFYNTEGGKECLNAYHFALYALLRGKDWRKCFAINSNQHTLQWLEYWLFKSEHMSLIPFGGSVTSKHITQLRAAGIPKWEDQI